MTAARNSSQISRDQRTCVSGSSSSACSSRRSSPRSTSPPVSTHFLRPLPFAALTALPFPQSRLLSLQVSPHSLDRGRTRPGSNARRVGAAPADRADPGPSRGRTADPSSRGSQSPSRSARQTTPGSAMRTGPFPVAAAIERELMARERSIGSAAFIPWSGGLAHVFGRRPVLLAGLTMFFIGSAMCGAAKTMECVRCVRAICRVGELTRLAQTHARRTHVPRSRVRLHPQPGRDRARRPRLALRTVRLGSQWRPTGS